MFKATLRECPSSIPVILCIAALLLVPMGAYVGGYFWLGDRVEFQADSTLDNQIGSAMRVYPYEWEAKLFTPAAMIESALSNREVTADTFFFQYIRS